jgi:long-chain acyl-CoA synthetase
MKHRTLPHLFLDQVKRYGDRTALREKDFGIWREISWREYGEHVRNFSLGLISLGLNRGNCVSILSENVPEWLYADLAIQSAGGISVGVYPTNPPPEVRYILGHSESIFCICQDQEQVDKVIKVKDDLPLLKNIIVIDMKGLRNYSDPMIISFKDVERMGREAHESDPSLFNSLVDKISPNDIALMVYTSGTTGPPKGSMLSHRNIIDMMEHLQQAIPFSERDEIVSYLPLCHIAERLFSMILPLYSGATVNFAESVETVTDALNEIYPTIFFAVPRIWEKIHSMIIMRIKDASWLKKKVYNWMMPIGMRYSGYKLSGKGAPFLLKLSYILAWIALFRPLQKKLGLRRVRLAFSGAAPISPDVLRYFHSIGIPVLEGYGLTEETGVACINLPEKKRLGTVGPPIPGMEIRIAEDGEILMRCGHIFEGYFKDPEATAKIKVDGWLYSGDVGEIDGDGHLRITDRKKEILITAGGKNIAPSEIENRLKVSPYISEAIVVGDGRKYLSALIQIDYENVGKWAQERGIPYTTFKSLAQNPEVYELIRKEIEEANKDFARVETIKKFKLLEKELDHDDEELTATMKVRRKAINKKFSDLIESLYRE